ncbi:MAG: 2-phosphosulfolactate phosphatase [Marinilabiliaceae bacterium]|nr:2-phosphosulfolactate phosphatase [Marinilabiliaceae bacterium]
MYVDIMSSAREIDPVKLNGAVAVVIDVLRATSVMITAFRNGVKEIIPVSSPQEAFELKKEYPNYILGGEQNADFIKGFDLDNSPFNYTTDKIAGRTLVMSTSNGTRAINGALEAKKLVVGSFINAQAVVDYLEGEDKVIFVCSGSNNAFTIEDALCAGFMASLMRNKYLCNVSDYAVAMIELYSVHRNNIKQLASQGSHYKILEEKGSLRDLDYCFTPSIFSLVPIMKDGRLIVENC